MKQSVRFALLTAACNSYVGQRVHRVALKRDFVGGAFAQVCEFKRVVNVAQVNVFLHGLGEESVVPGKRIYCSRLGSL